MSLKMSLRKMRNTSINVSPNTSPNTSIVSTVSTVPPCIICLDEVRCRGKITVCEHWFCFGCIVEWSKNTNTCPICKARFRTISKVHLSPMKSPPPPTKIRVPDKDQRVWNDDDNVVLEDLITDARNDMREDMDDDYEPQRNFHPLQENEFDEYDLEDSFIDDSSISQTFPFEEHIYLNVDTADEDERNWMPRESHSGLRRSRNHTTRRNGVSIVNIDVTIGIDIDGEASSSSSNDEYCSTVSEGSFIVHDDSDDDDLYTQDSHPTTRTKSKTSQPSRPPRRHASTRSSSKRSTETTTSSTSSNGSRQLKQRAAKKRRQEEQVIAHNIRETGSSGWLSTSRRPGRAAAVSAARAIAQTVHEQHSPNVRGKPITASQSDRRRMAQDNSINTTRDNNDGNTSEDNSDAPVRTLPTSTNTIGHRDVCYGSGANARGETISSDYDSDSDTQVETTWQHRSNNQIHQRRSPISSNILSTQATSLETLDKGSNNSHTHTGKRKRAEGKENKPLRSSERKMARKRTTLQQMKISDYEQVNRVQKPALEGLVPKTTRSTSRINYGNCTVSAGPSTRSCYDDDTDEDSSTYNDDKLYGMNDVKSVDASGLDDVTVDDVIGDGDDVIVSDKHNASNNEGISEDETTSVLLPISSNIPSTRATSWKSIDEGFNISHKHTGKRKRAEGKENKPLRSSERMMARKRTTLQQMKITDCEQVNRVQKPALEGLVPRTTRSTSRGPATRPYYYEGDSDDDNNNDDDDDDDDDDDTDEDSTYNDDKLCGMNDVKSVDASGLDDVIVDDVIDSDKHDASDNDANSEDETTSVLMPTPQDGKKRSLFTRRQHKPMPRGFDDDSDAEQN